jgi:hypothetical protein
MGLCIYEPGGNDNETRQSLLAVGVVLTSAFPPKIVGAPGGIAAPNLFFKKAVGF